MNLTEEEQQLADDIRKQIGVLKRKLKTIVPNDPLKRWSIDHIEQKPYKELFHKVYAKYSHKYSSRECEVMTLLNMGMTNSRIATNMFISVKSVKFHLSNIFKKMQVKNRASAIVEMHKVLY